MIFLIPETKKEFFYGSTSINSLVIILLIFHFMRFGVDIFRSYDVHHNGELNEIGVKTAKREQKLAMVEIFFACLIVGFCINQLIAMGV